MRMCTLKDIPIFLQDDIKQKHQMILKRQSSQEGGIGILLFGEPGNGKSTYAKYIACQLQLDIYLVNLSRVKNVSELFAIVYKLTDKKSIVLIEDIDRVWASKIINADDKFNAEDSENKIGLDALLSFIDSLIEKKMLVLVTCNKKLMDDAFLRGGRFDFKIEMSMCNKAQLNQIVECLCNRDTRCTRDVNDYIENFKESESSVAKVCNDVLNF